MKDLAIKGLKKVAGETKAIGLGEKGLIHYNKKFGSVRFEGVWRDYVQFCQVGTQDDEITFTVRKPMTMREIKKMVAKVIDYDTYIKMDLEDDGVVIY